MHDRFRGLIHKTSQVRRTLYVAEDLDLHTPKHGPQDSLEQGGSVEHCALHEQGEPIVYVGK